MKKFGSRWIASLITVLAFASLTAPVQAQTFPTKPLSIAVAYPPGGPADTLARSIGEAMQERLGQPVLVINRPGAGGQIAASAVLNAPADGYSMLIGDTSTLGINSVVYPKFSFDPLSDFQAVAPLVVLPMVLYVPSSSPYRTLAELVAASRNKSLNYASQGAGSIGHVLGEMFAAETGIQPNHVPYKGGAPAVLAVMAGEVDFLFGGIVEGLQHLKTGKLKALAVAGPKRLPQIPDVPTTAEAGFANVDLSLWLGVVVRAETPAPIVQRLHDEIAHALTLPKVTSRFTDQGFQLMHMSSDEFGAFIRREHERSAALVRARKIVLE